MERKTNKLKEIFDATKMTKIVFVRKDGKLAMARKTVSTKATKAGSKPMFPISKERK